jgi:hypothetical protein
MAKGVSLPAEVAAKYKLVNYTGGHTQFWGKYGKINVNELTLQHADRLFSQGWPKLTLKEKSSKEATTAKKDK